MSSQHFRLERIYDLGARENQGPSILELGLWGKGFDTLVKTTAGLVPDNKEIHMPLSFL